MKSHRSHFVILLATLFLSYHAVAVDGSTSLTITMELERSRTLPGIPVGFRFRAFNNSDDVAEMPTRYVLEVGQDGSQPALVPFSSSLHGPKPTSIQPRETRSFLVIVDGNGTSPEELLTPRFMVPGHYRLRAGLSNALRDDPMLHLELLKTMDEVKNRVPTLILTNEVSLQIDEPQGVDLSVWNLIMERSEGKGPLELPIPFGRKDLAREVWDRYRTSRYLPYMISILDIPREDRPILRQHIVNLDPQHPMLDHFDLGTARGYEQAVRQAIFTERDLTRALEMARLAREAFSDFISKTNNGVLREEARSAYAEVYTDEVIFQIDRRRSSWANPAPPTALKVRPFVTCSKATGFNVKVVFGYENPNAFRVTIPIGESNRFEPGEDRLQPTTFLPGIHAEVVTIEIEGKKKDTPRSVAWTLDGTKVTAPSKKDPNCKK